MVKKSKVAVLYTNPLNILDDYERLAGLAGVKDHLNTDSSVILKDNISWHYPMPGANTTPWQLEGTILALKKFGFEKLACVQNKTVVINAHKGENLNCHLPVLQKHGIPVLYNFKDDMKWIEYKPKGKMLVLNKIYGNRIMIPDYFFDKNIVHLPTAKCHIYTTTTGAMKNAFGGLLNTHRHYTHSWIHETLVDLLRIQKEIHSGIFAVMDATTAGNGPGPRALKPEVKNVILASGDQTAIDAVAAKMMGFDPLKIPYIKIAHDEGLGVGDPGMIEIVGDDITDVNWQFKVGFSFHRLLGWMSWYGPTKFLQKLIFRTPIVNIPILISEFNHDFLRWPFLDRRKYNKWLSETEWGKLFDKYKHLEGKC